MIDVQNVSLHRICTGDVLTLSIDTLERLSIVIVFLYFPSGFKLFIIKLLVVFYRDEEEYSSNLAVYTK